MAKGKVHPLEAALKTQRHPFDLYIDHLTKTECERAEADREDTSLRKRILDLLESDTVEVEVFDGNVITAPNRAGLTSSEIAERLHAPLSSVLAALEWLSTDDEDGAAAIAGGGRGKPWRAVGRTEVLAPVPPSGWQPPARREPEDPIADKVMLALEHSDGGMTVKELVTLTGVRRTTIQSCLERLKEVGKVEGGGRGLRWRSPTSTTTTSNFPTTTDYLYTFPTTPSAPINRDTVKERSDEA